jgi:hypothetical protein
VEILADERKNERMEDNWFSKGLIKAKAKAKAKVSRLTRLKLRTTGFQPVY